MDPEDKKGGGEDFKLRLARMAGESARRMAEIEPWRNAKPNSLVGWDLGLRVADILSKKIREEQVRTIFIADFLGDTESEWKQLIERCKETCWTKDPKAGEEIAERLMHLGKVKESKESAEGHSNAAIIGWVKVEDTDADVNEKLSKQPVYRGDWGRE